MESELGRFWRGEVSLAKSYWVYGVLLSVAAMLLSFLIAGAGAAPNLGPGVRLTIFASWLLALVFLMVWQTVGIWRSAGTHIRVTQRKGWAIAARIAIIYGLLQFVVALAPLQSILGETLKLARGDDPIPAHQLRLMRDGTELEISGGMPIGTADAVKKFLNAAPAVQVVHLNSLGGRIAEGFQLLKVFRERGLITYTSSNCYSACTIAFLGGSQRYLSKEANLGFHSASFAGLDEKELPGLNDEMRTILLEQGAPRWFVDKALSTPSDSMWYPLQTELVEANIVTAVVDSSQFAMSGFKGWQNTQLLESALAKVPYARVLKQHNPGAFKKIALRFTEGVKLGKSKPELSGDIYGVFTREILPGYLRAAPDAALVRYWRSQIAEISYLAENHPQQCLVLLQLVPRPSDFDLIKTIPAKLVEEDQSSLVAVIEATHRDPGPPTKANEAELRQLFVKVISELNRQKPGAADFVYEPAQHLDNPQLLCRSLVAFYEVIMYLPTSQAAAMLRSFSES